MAFTQRAVNAHKGALVCGSGNEVIEYLADTIGRIGHIGQATLKES